MLKMGFCGYVAVAKMGKMLQGSFGQIFSAECLQQFANAEATLIYSLIKNCNNSADFFLTML